MNSLSALTTPQNCLPNQEPVQNGINQTQLQIPYTFLSLYSPFFSGTTILERLNAQKPQPNKNRITDRNPFKVTFFFMNHRIEKRGSCPSGTKFTERDPNNQNTINNGEHQLNKTG